MGPSVTSMGWSGRASLGWNLGRGLAERAGMNISCYYNSCCGNKKVSKLRTPCPRTPEGVPQPFPYLMLPPGPTELPPRLDPQEGDSCLLHFFTCTPGVCISRLLFILFPASPTPSSLPPLPHLHPSPLLSSWIHPNPTQST